MSIWGFNHGACEALETQMPGQAGAREELGGGHSLSGEDISLLTVSQFPRSYTKASGHRLLPSWI